MSSDAVIRHPVFTRLPLWLKRALCFLNNLGTVFVTHQAPLRASALTYTTLLSLVPFLAIAFSVLKGLGVQNALEPLLLQVAGESSRETVSQIIGYVNNTNVKSLGVVGLLFLLVTVVSLLSTIEDAFNNIVGGTGNALVAASFQRLPECGGGGAAVVDGGHEYDLKSAEPVAGAVVGPEYAAR